MGLFSSKFAIISENSNKKEIFESDFVEGRNSELQACNIKEKGVVLRNE